MAEVAVLGVGRMGAAMARKLVEGGHQVTVWNRTVATADSVADEIHASVVHSPGEAVASVELVISMLASGTVTESILLSEEVLQALRPGTRVCDMATSGVATAVNLDRALGERGIAFIDAPVSGSVPSVLGGQLLVMASGRKSEVDDVAPILMAFAKRVAYLGPAGAGQSMKLAVNLVVHSLNAALAEALTLAAGAGVSADVAYDVLLDSSVAAPYVVYKKQAFLDDQAPVAMSLGLTNKDLKLITEFAAEHGIQASVVQAVQDEVAAACAAGYDAQDMAALFRFFAARTA